MTLLSAPRTSPLRSSSLTPTLLPPHRIKSRSFEHATVGDVRRRKIRNHSENVHSLRSTVRWREWTVDFWNRRSSSISVGRISQQHVIWLSCKHTPTIYYAKQTEQTKWWGEWERDTILTQLEYSSWPTECQWCSLAVRARVCVTEIFYSKFETGRD